MNNVMMVNKLIINLINISHVNKNGNQTAAKRTDEHWTDWSNWQSNQTRIFFIPLHFINNTDM